MFKRRQALLVLVLVFPSVASAAYRTTNFLVEAPSPQVAQQIGQAAELYRKQKALEWLGQEMPTWPEPCPIRVKVTLGGAGGATTFSFDQGRVCSQHMNIEGSLDRLLASVLPHEITHTVFAHYFRCPVPRWADEGGAVLSEDDVERSRHDMLVRQILNSGRAFPLRRLFAMRDYPPDMKDVMVLYAEGFSVSSYLVGLSSRPTFLAFIAHGMQNQGWDSAVRTYYRLNSVEELEQAWLAHLRSTRRAPAQFAQGTGPAPAEPTNRVVVRQTAPPVQPTLVTPIIRAQAPDQDNQPRAASIPASRPGYLPGPTGNHSQSAPPASWQPTGPPAAFPAADPHPTIILGPPQFETPPRDFR